MAVIPLNALDRQGVVHVVHTYPDNIKMGFTVCRYQFTFPMYSEYWAINRWTGTHDHVTCLTCLVST